MDQTSRGAAVPADVDVWWSSLLAAGRDLLPLLDDVERARVSALGRPADQGRSVVAAALLRVAVGERLGVPAQDVVVDRTCGDCGRPHGRPRVVGPAGPAPHVSVSHSGLLVVVAVSPAAPVGVDVQRVADLADHAGTGADDALAAAASSWVRDEAVVKTAPGPGEVVVRALEAPLDGYAAALAVRTRSGQEPRVVVRHWPSTTCGRASPQR